MADPYAEDTDELFVAAMNAANTWHVERSPFFASLWGARPPLESIVDLARQPFVHANFFKTHEVSSVPPEEVAVTATSSGTSGQRSRMPFDARTLETGRWMIERIFAHHGWLDTDPVHYLLYTNQPAPGPVVGSARTGQLLTDFAPAASVDYGLVHTGDGHEFDAFGCIRALCDFAADGRPVRIFGFPAFLSFTLDRMRAMGLPPLRLADRSLVLFAGGWKGHADVQIAKPELYARITDQLGIPDERIRDGYGAVEHSVPYIECREHHLHVPTWSRVLVRDVATLEPLPHGEPGYLNFVSPYITSAPAQSVLMGDLATLHEPDECGCDLPTPWFVIRGRAGLSRNRSCAIAAAELLKGKR